MREMGRAAVSFVFFPRSLCKVKENNWSLWSLILIWRKGALISYKVRKEIK
jgi:hypothetical protein